MRLNQPVTQVIVVLFRSCPQVLKRFGGVRNSGREGDEELQEVNGNEGLEVFDDFEDRVRSGVVFGRGNFCAEVCDVGE
jgi:hypothetical protein